MKKKVFTVSILGLVAVLGLLAWRNTPYKQAVRFIQQNGPELTRLIDSGQPLPLDLGWQFYNCWDGEHPMTEFILASHDGTYYGVYYSPDDVPLSFQNSGAELKAAPETGWQWKGKGVSHGTTQKIVDGWYYFTAVPG